MAGRNTAVYGLYRDRTDAERAVEALYHAGFRSTDTAVLFPQNEGTKDLVLTRGAKLPEGLAVGATSGAILGGTFGWLVAAGLVALPDLGQVMAAGPIMATLAGVGAGGVICGIVGAMTGLAMPEYEAKRYEGQIRRGGILMSVHCDNRSWANRARKVLDDTGAEDITTAAEARADFGRSDKPMPRRVAHRLEPSSERLDRRHYWPELPAAGGGADYKAPRAEPADPPTKRPSGTRIRI